LCIPEDVSFIDEAALIGGPIERLLLDENRRFVVHREFLVDVIDVEVV
jgi:hypothetical protein